MLNGPIGETCTQCGCLVSKVDMKAKKIIVVVVDKIGYNMKEILMWGLILKVDIR